MWEKIVLNLMSNALKFTFDGAIAVSLGEDDDGVALRVRDTGIGIPASELPHAVRALSSRQGARARTHEGSGIGLALVKSWCSSTAAAIAADSELGRGTDVHGYACRTGSAHLPAERIVARAHAGMSTATGATAFVEEALRWLPDQRVRRAGDAARPKPRRRAGQRESRRRASWSPTTTPTCATTCAALLVARWSVDAVADGALRSTRRARAFDVILSRRDDAGPRRLRLLRELRADDAHAATSRSSCCRRAPAKKRASKACGPAPTTISSSHSPRAS